MRVVHNGTTCNVRIVHYHKPKDRVAITLTDAEDGSPYDIPSVNIPDVPCQEGEVFIRDDGYRAGMLESLIEGGIVEPPHRRVPMGWITAAVCRLKEVPDA